MKTFAKKQLSIFLIISIITLMVCTVPVYAASQFNNFSKSKNYTNQFSDVPNGAWYEQNVIEAYELGLMIGSNDTQFNTTGNITIVETLALACRIHSTYYKNGTSFIQGSPWYQVYVDYAKDNSILTYEFDNYTRAATRAEFAIILASALPKEALNKINNIDDGAIPDVSGNASYYNSVYTLYNAGILTGNDSSGSFTPNSNIQRNAVAAIVTRMANPTLRKSIELKADNINKELSAEEIYKTCSPAVFYIETYDTKGSIIGTGSGFFINSNGTAVTNYHVIKGANTAKIHLTNNKVYNVSGVYDYSSINDWAILKIEGTQFPYLKKGNLQTINGGSSVYAIGSPLGLQNTISSGIVSNTNRQLDGTNFLQISAPISPGSSGGALLNKYGEVIGITSAQYTTGQNLNLAIPISYINNANLGGTLKKLSEITSYYENITSSSYSIDIVAGETKSLYITLQTDYDDEFFINYDISNTNSIQCSWGEWVGSTIPINITGVNAGSSTIYLYSDIPATNKKTISINVNVTPAQTGNLVGYSKYPFIPDFGAYYGISTYYVGTSPGTGYYYLYDDISYYGIDDNDYTEYLSTLIDYGFVYYSKFVNRDGYEMYVYNNYYWGYGVAFGYCDLDAPCLCVFVSKI